MKNIVKKGEIAYDKEFHLFSQCFLHYTELQIYGAIDARF